MIPSYILLESDPVFMEIEQTIKAKPTEAKSVNSIYIFVIKSNGTPVKRWGMWYNLIKSLKLTNIFKCWISEVHQDLCYADHLKTILRFDQIVQLFVMIKTSSNW